MKGIDVLRYAYDIMQEVEAENQDFTQHALGDINVLIGETFNVNNNLRESKGLEPLAEYPLISALEEEIPYEPELLLTCLPYGLCEKYVEPDGDPSRTGYYNSLYVNGVNYCTRGISQPGGIEDIY